MFEQPSYDKIITAGATAAAVIAVVGCWITAVWLVNDLRPDLAGSWIPGVVATIAVVIAIGAFWRFVVWADKRWPYDGDGADGLEAVACGVIVIGPCAAFTVGAMYIAGALSLATDHGIGAAYAAVWVDTIPYLSVMLQGCILATILTVTLTSYIASQ